MKIRIILFALILSATLAANAYFLPTVNTELALETINGDNRANLAFQRVKPVIYLAEFAILASLFVHLFFVNKNNKPTNNK